MAGSRALRHRYRRILLTPHRLGQETAVRTVQEMAVRMARETAVRIAQEMALRMACPTAIRKTPPGTDRVRTTATITIYHCTRLTRMIWPRSPTTLGPVTKT